MATGSVEVYHPFIDPVSDLTVDFVDHTEADTGIGVIEIRTHATRKFLDGDIQTHLGEHVETTFQTIKRSSNGKEIRKEKSIQGVLESVDFQSILIRGNSTKKLHSRELPWAYQKYTAGSGLAMGITRLVLATDGRNLIPNL